MRMGQEEGGRQRAVGEPITVRGQTERQDNQDLFVSAEPLGQWTGVTTAVTHTKGKLSKLVE